MTPTVPELLNGCMLTLMTPPRAEDTGLFSAARLRLIALVNKLAALESADGTAVRVSENAALRTLIMEAGARHDISLGDAADTSDGDYSLAVLDAVNAKLRRLVMRLHEAAEQADDIALDRRILKLYGAMARRRELHLAPVKPVA
jgi:hypothetical protein